MKSFENYLHILFNPILDLDANENLTYIEVEDFISNIPSARAIVNIKLFINQTIYSTFASHFIATRESSQLIKTCVVFLSFVDLLVIYK